MHRGREYPARGHHRGRDIGRSVVGDLDREAGEDRRQLVLIVNGDIPTQIINGKAGKRPRPGSGIEIERTLGEASADPLNAQRALGNGRRIVGRGVSRLEVLRGRARRKYGRNKRQPGRTGRELGDYALLDIKRLLAYVSGHS